MQILKKWKFKSLISTICAVASSTNLVPKKKQEKVNPVKQNEQFDFEELKLNKERIRNSQSTRFLTTNESVEGNLNESLSYYTNDNDDYMNFDEEEFHYPRSSVHKKISLNDFNLEKLVGQGAFGKVFLVTTKTKSPEFYAMKALKKDSVLKNNEMESIFLERDVSKLGNKNPYLTKLFASFKNNVNF